MPQGIEIYGEMAERAIALKNEATALMVNPIATAEDFDKAEKMITDAERIMQSSERLKAIKGNVEVNGQNVGDNVDKSGDARQDPTAADFKNWGEFFNAVKSANKGNVDPRMTFMRGEHRVAAKDLSGNIGSAGGWLAPTQFIPQILSLTAEASIVRGRATVIPMATRSIEMPALEQGGSTAGQTNYFGGIQTYYTAEWATITSTDIAWRLIELRAHDLNALIHVPDSLLADSAISLSAWIQGPMGIAGAMAHRADQAYFKGTGAGQPMGILNSGATIAQTRAGGGAISIVDIINIFSKSMPTPGRVWVAHVSTLPQLLQLSGPSGNASYLWLSGTDGQPSTLMGIPIIFTEKVNVLGAIGDIGLYDFGFYLIGERENLIFNQSDQPKWLQNGTSFKATMRHDAQTWLDLPFTLEDGSTQLSPFVVLAA